MYLKCASYTLILKLAIERLGKKFLYIVDQVLSMLVVKLDVAGSTVHDKAFGARIECETGRK